MRAVTLSESLSLLNSQGTSYLCNNAWMSGLKNHTNFSRPVGFKIRSCSSACGNQRPCPDSLTLYYQNLKTATDRTITALTFLDRSESLCRSCVNPSVEDRYSEGMHRTKPGLNGMKSCGITYSTLMNSQPTEPLYSVDPSCKTAG